MSARLFWSASLAIATMAAVIAVVRGWADTAAIWGVSVGICFCGLIERNRQA